METTPVESFDELPDRFPGIETLDPRAISRFVFHCAGNFPQELHDEEDSRWTNHDERPEWLLSARELMLEVGKWRSQDGEKPTRLELAQAARDQYTLSSDTTELLDKIKQANLSEGLDRVLSYLDSWGFEAEIPFNPSPLFPKGRTVRKSAKELVDPETGTLFLPYGTNIVRDNPLMEDSQDLDERVKDYLDDGYPSALNRDKVQQAFEIIGPISKDSLEQLRLSYGAKAANLIAFKQVIDEFYTQMERDNIYITDISIPPFVAVDVDMYDSWTEKRGDYNSLLEIQRNEALGLATQAVGGLVVIRSSAVFSEDGEHSTGAGIYKSVVVDPTDTTAFREAIDEVYASTDSADARSYRESLGIDSEKMGLVMQAYSEETGSDKEVAFGFVNSRSANPNLIEVHTPRGVLLFDKAKVSSDLMVNRPRRDVQDYLHVTPDHSKPLRFMVYRSREAVHATLLAEKVFGKPVQLEYTGNDIVQVRPLAGDFKETVNVEFPDMPELVTSKAIGMGDIMLKELDQRNDNSEEEGFVVFWSEHRFTDDYHRQHAGVNALPKRGAVLIMNHSDSGHIQTLCQERGLMCFYPESADDKSLRDIEVNDSQPFRFVSDGYNGRIYSVNND